MDIIPSDLATFGGEAKRLLQDLQTRNERLFLVTILIMNTATNRQKLENAVFQTAAIAQKYNCALKRLLKCWQPERNITRCFLNASTEPKRGNGFTLLLQ